MSGSKYLLVALPASIDRSNDLDEAFNRLKSVITPDVGTVSPFPIPEFKIGTLDALVLQADELAKLDANVEGAVVKVTDVLRNIVPGQEAGHKLVGDKPVDKYLQSFQWNKVKYRADKSIAENLAALQREVVALDADIKTAYTAYQNIKTSLITVQRKTQGNLTVRSLAPLLKRSEFVSDSEYLETLLIVVPKQSQKEWLKTYEKLTDMVVPRSSQKLYEDDEYTLYNVTLFKKFSAEFVSKARAAKFTPRDFTWSENAAEADEQEARDIQEQERQLFNEILHLARTGYSDLFAAWIHVKALRVFVESVLRYGLPLEFVSAIVKTSGEKAAKKVKGQLDAAFGYLGGNAFGRDKKGNIKDDVGDVGALAHGQEDYSAYCFFQFDVA
ncbi:hypothetical protein BDD12DRAFT_877157 [Trichophaea hybrida]|nr:hypothetical protein BDD12DRAFT_877157 [Trichophaea hybrida]